MKRPLTYRPLWTLVSAGPALGLLGVLSLTACPSDLPNVDPNRFACLDDAPLADGERPCPDTHWCEEGICTPRFACTVIDEFGGRVRSCGRDTLTRCEPAYNEENSVVRCEPGVHTSTSVRSIDGACACGDGLHCVAFAQANSAPESYPLVLLPEGGGLPSLTGVLGEVAEWRVCARACSSEVDCPALHTCRSTVVASTQVLDGSGGSRHTIGVCYPDRLVPTSSTSTLAQPAPDQCLTNLECPGPLVCTFQNERVEDSPLVPAAQAWGQSRFALHGRCASGQGKAGDNIGCAMAPNSCQSGICLGSKCRTVCDPQRPIVCGSGKCVEQFATRTLMSEANETITVTDRVFICE